MLKNVRKERFCQELVKGKSATQAYIAAGYSANGAGQSAERLLKNADVAARVAELRRAAEKRAQVDADWVIAELAKIAKADIRKFYNADGSLKPVYELDDECAAALSAMEIVDLGENGILRKVKRWDRPKVLELLGKHFGLWPNKVEHNINLLDGMSPDEWRTLRDALDALDADAPGAGGGAGRAASTHH